MAVRQVIPKKHFDPGDITSLRIVGDTLPVNRDASVGVAQMLNANDLAKNYRRDAHVSFSGVTTQDDIGTAAVHTFQSVNTQRPQQTAAINMPHAHRIKNRNTGAQNSRMFLVLAIVLAIAAVGVYVFN
jgi:hypothetical protein